MKTYTYYIYHIPGIKIGCTTEIEKRMKDQGFTNWEILWQQEGDFDFGWTAGDKEIELQRQYGLPVDKSNYQISRMHRQRMGISGGHTTGIIKKNGGFHQSKIQSELSKRRKSFGPGYIFSVEERSKAHNHANSFKNKRIKCEHCNQDQTTGNYARWHGDKCKQNQLN